LNSWVRGCPSIPATTAGRLYHLDNRADPVYPLADFDEEGTIVGDLFEVPLEQFEPLARMELRAGYELRTVTVRTARGDRDAQVFHWPHEQRGFHIEEGDWRRYVGCHS
jgi:gamma-glutamylcyclotransferase (GGCT)/AIG2-like uncharacterized protein YtfP